MKVRGTTGRMNMVSVQDLVVARILSRIQMLLGWPTLVVASGACTE